MNPELQRNLWLEAGPRKLAWVAVVLAVIYGAALVVTGAAETPRDLARVLTVVGAGVFVVSALFWGPRAAGRALGNEVQQKTWDFQRLSVLSPWEMTVGKLLGSTALPWLAALSGIAAFNLGLWLGVRSGEALGRPAPWWTLAGIGLAVLMQAGALAMALVGVRRARADGRPPALRLGWGNGIGALVLFWAVGRSVPGLGGQALGPRLPLGGDRWWGMDIGQTRMFALTAAVFGAWAVVAAWRLMRLELQMQNRPWAWPGFLVFAAAWMAGFAVDGGARFAWAAAGMVFGLGAYASAFAEPADRVRLRRWVLAVRRLDWERLYLTVPAPWSALKLGALAVVGLMATAPDGETGLLALAAFAFVVRDIGVIAFFRFGPRTRRGDFGAVLGLFLLYFVGGAVGMALSRGPGLALFVPTPGHALVSLVSGLVMGGLVWAAAWSRIRAPERTES
jgi:hypothetical protein